MVYIHEQSKHQDFQRMSNWENLKHFLKILNRLPSNKVSDFLEVS